jgi:hypothetical protein
LKWPTIFKDPDVKRSVAYLAISVIVSGIKSAVQYIRNRRNGNGLG